MNLESFRKVTSGSESLIACDQIIATTYFAWKLCITDMLVYYNYVHTYDNYFKYELFINGATIIQGRKLFKGGNY